MHYLFLHGFLGNARDWDEVISYLPFPCLALDYPFHLTQPAHIVGYSMGGRIALQLASQYPEKVLSLTLISAHLGLKTEAEKQARLRHDQALANEILESDLDSFLTKWYDQPLFRTLVAKRNIQAMRQQQDPQLLAKMLLAHSLGLQPDYSSSLPPNTRLIAGEFDEAYRRHYQNFPHTLIPNAGHAIHLEEPQALAEVLCS